MTEKCDLIRPLKDRMLSAKRPELLALLAAAITEMTIRGRSHYDSPDVAQRLKETNEAIHRLVGHIRDLCDSNEIYTLSRAGGVAEQLNLLDASALSRLQRFTAEAIGG